MAKKKKKWFSVTEKDLKFQKYRGSGKGGQKRNKVESAFRCIHEPSGAVGQCEEFREPIQNKRKAFERMAKSPEFQAWLKLKIDAGLGKVSVEHLDSDGKVKKKYNLSHEEV